MSKIIVGIVVILIVSFWWFSPRELFGTTSVSIIQGAYGEIATTTIPIAYTVVVGAQDTFYEVTPFTSLSAGSSGCFTQSANGRLQYTCDTTQRFHCASSISYNSATTNQVVRVRMGDTGATIAESETRDTVAVTDKNESTALHSMLTLSTNDYVSVWIANGAGANNIIVDTLNIFCMVAM